MNEPRIVFFAFMGRRANMEIQRPYVEQLLADYPTAEFHLWDLTRDPTDQIYLLGWAESHERIAYVGHLHTGHPIACLGFYRGRGHRRCRCMKHKPPYEQPYRYYRDNPHRGSNVPDYDDNTVFVKFDDDVLWMDTERFDEVLSFLETHPDDVASANVANNAVCAKYEPRLAKQCMKRFSVGNPHDPANDRDWWRLHTLSQFAELSHEWMRKGLEGKFNRDAKPFRTRPGEAISINFVAMKYPVLCKVANIMTDRLGDEGAMDSLLPWIIPNFRVAHLSFGPQENDLDPVVVENIRKQYALEAVREEELT